jgi:hypothetical protein
VFTQNKIALFLSEIAPCRQAEGSTPSIFCAAWIHKCDRFRPSTSRPDMTTLSGHPLFRFIVAYRTTYPPSLVKASLAFTRVKTDFGATNHGRKLDWVQQFNDRVATSQIVTFQFYESGNRLRSCGTSEGALRTRPMPTLRQSVNFNCDRPTADSSKRSTTPLQGYYPYSAGNRLE